MLQAAEQRQLRALAALARQTVGRRFLGRRQDRRLQAGAEATDVVDYYPGAGWTSIDWPRAARHDELVVRQFHGTEQTRVALVLDCSASMGGGEKFDFARRVAAGLGGLALANHDALTAVAAAGNQWDVLELVAQREQPRLFAWLKDRTAAGETDLEGTARWLLRRPRRPGLVVWISDFWDPPGVAPALRLLARRQCEAFWLQVASAADAAPPAAGRWTLRDAETDETLGVDLDAADREAYSRAMEQYSDGLRAACRRHGAWFVRADAAAPWHQVVRSLLQASVARGLES